MKKTTSVQVLELPPLLIQTISFTTQIITKFTYK